jgi:hypothetical protein
VCVTSSFAYSSESWKLAVHYDGGELPFLILPTHRNLALAAARHCVIPSRPLVVGPIRATQIAFFRRSYEQSHACVRAIHCRRYIAILGSLAFSLIHTSTWVQASQAPQEPTVPGSTITMPAAIPVVPPLQYFGVESSIRRQVTTTRRLFLRAMHGYRAYLDVWRRSLQPS